MKTLRKINLSTHQQITDEGLHELMCGLSGTLTHINVDHCRGINPQSIITALRTCTRLESFSALFCANAALSRSHLQALTTGEILGRKLESLSIELADNACEQREVIHSFLKQFGNTLKSLHLRGWRHINPIMSDELTQICSSLTNLEKLTVACNSAIVTENNVANRSALLIESDSIKELILSRFDNLKRPIFKCGNLKKLQLDSIMSLQDITLVTPSLNELKMRSCRLELNEQNTPFDKILETVPSLRRVDIFDCTGFSRFNISQKSMQGLEYLDLYMCSDLEEITLKCQSLKNLNIDACLELKRARIECPALTTATLFTLPQPMQVPIMGSLYLSSQQLTHLSLPRCVNLQSIEIECPKLISINLNECKVLQELSLTCPNLEKLALSAPKITFNSRFADDLGSRCPKIHLLSLSNTPMDDDALRKISAWDSLCALVVSNCERLVNPWVENSSKLKGIQFMDCANLESPVVRCNKLIKLFYRNCPKINNTALSLSNCTELKFLEVLNCANLENVRFESTQCHTVHFGSCHKLTHLELNAPQIGKLTVSDCPNFRNWKFTQVVPKLTEIVLDKCPVISDEAMLSAAQMSPNVQTCHVKQCHALVQPILSWNNLKLIDFLECTNLIQPRLHPMIPKATLSFKVCPRLGFHDFSDISTSVDFVEIVNCEGLSGKVRFPLQGMNRLNIALCHRLGAMELYNSNAAPSRLEKLLITHCRELKMMHVQANQKSIIAQLKDCPHLQQPIVDAPARVIARMMGCFLLGCVGSNMLERVFTHEPQMITPMQQHMLPQHIMLTQMVQQQQQQRQQQQQQQHIQMIPPIMQMQRHPQLITQTGFPMPGIGVGRIPRFLDMPPH
jgi:hypothetical protein